MSVEGEYPGIEMMRQFVASSPFARKLGIEVVELGPDLAHLRLPYDQSLVTVGEIVHGGAIGTLADTAATAACWTAADVSLIRSGSTVSLTVDYMEAATSTALDARASVLRRGRSICFAEIAVTSESGEPVAHALATYRFALAKPSGES